MSQRRAKGVSTDLFQPKINVPEALSLRIKDGLTYEQIGAKFGVSKEAARQALLKFTHIAESPEILEAYRQQKLAVFETVEKALLERLLREITDGRASVGDLARAMDVLTKNIRLMTGQSTQNIGLLVQTLTDVHKDVDVAMLPKGNTTEAEVLA